MKIDLNFTLNGSPIKTSVAVDRRLVDLLRDELDLTGTKIGCEEGECGACTVLVDGQAVNSCLFPAPEVDGKHVITIEGLGESDNRLSELQQAFVDQGGIQCGFCSPGMILSARALLNENPNPSPDEIREALGGNLCRCTGYVQIVDSIQTAAARENSDD